MELKPEDIVISEWSRGERSGFSYMTVNGVQIVHRPTGAMVQVDTERSQHKNKAIAMKMLQTKLDQIQQGKSTEQDDNGLPVTNYYDASISTQITTKQKDVYTLASANHVPRNLVLNNNSGKQVGKLTWTDTGCTFEGDADEAAQIFVKALNSVIGQDIVRSHKLEQELNELKKKYDAVCCLVGKDALS